MLSFRDPDGFLFYSDGRLFRKVRASAAGDVCAFMESALFAELSGNKSLIESQIVSRDDDGLTIEHAVVRFPSFPYEWPPEMLHAAAELTLKLAESALKCGYGLKDASPYNVLFEGPRPVFVDLLSFDRRDPLDPLWRPFAQFMRMFVYPLVVNRILGVEPREFLLLNREGLEPARMLHLLPFWSLLSPGLAGTVTIPALFSRKGGISREDYRPRQAASAGECTFLLNRLFRKARKALNRAASPHRNGSEAARYMDDGHEYSAGQLASKEAAVAEIVQSHRPRAVLDIGCNTGHFSKMAARTGAMVVSIDRDASCIGDLWRSAGEESLDILPLLVDIARPSPAMGWANEETASFLARARGRFDLVMMLAVLHHLLVSERVPLSSIVDLASKLTTDLLLIEYVDREDPQFVRIARGREALHADFTRAQFESLFQDRFDPVLSRDVTATRSLYLFRRRAN